MSAIEQSGGDEMDVDTTEIDLGDDPWALLLAREPHLRELAPQLRSAGFSPANRSTHLRLVAVELYLGVVFSYFLLIFGVMILWPTFVLTAWLYEKRPIPSWLAVSLLACYPLLIYGQYKTLQIFDAFDCPLSPGPAVRAIEIVCVPWWQQLLRGIFMVANIGALLILGEFLGHAMNEHSPRGMIGWVMVGIRVVIYFGTTYAANVYLVGVLAVISRSPRLVLRVWRMRVVLDFAVGFALSAPAIKHLLFET